MTQKSSTGQIELKGTT